MTVSDPNSASPSRADLVQKVMQETGLSEALLQELVETFYAKLRLDPLLGPIFAAHVHDWPEHLERIGRFWSSVALMTGRYQGSPVEAHRNLPVDWSHFQRWLMLFGQTAHALLPASGADYLILRAERIARSLHNAIEDHRKPQTAPPRLI